MKRDRGTLNLLLFKDEFLGMVRSFEWQSHLFLGTFICVTDNSSFLYVNL